MQDNGFDVQICGFGLSARYHAENECCSLSKMQEATRILAHVISRLEASS
jgi:acetylornithine deacetylase